MPPAWYEVIISPMESAARRGGANSVTTARAIGISPPRPRPARNRPAPKAVTDGASAHSAEPTENSETLQTTTGRRPSQSVSVPAVRAPISMPKVVQLPTVPAVEAVKPREESSSRCGITAP